MNQSTSTQPRLTVTPPPTIPWRNILIAAAVLITVVFASFYLNRPAKIEPFTIGSQKGLTSYVSYDQAIDLAEKHGIGLYRGQGWNEQNRITPAQARQLKDVTDQVQVTARVRTGDYFDPENGIYEPIEGRN